MAQEDNLKTIAQVVEWMEDTGMRGLAAIVFRAHNYELSELRKKLGNAEFDLREVKSELAIAKKDLAEARADAKSYFDALACPDIH